MKRHEEIASLPSQGQRPAADPVVARSAATRQSPRMGKSLTPFALFAWFAVRYQHSSLSRLLCAKRSFLSKKQAQSGMKPALCLLITMLLCYGSGRHDAHQGGFGFRLYKHLRPYGDFQFITMNKSTANNSNRP